MKFLKDIIQIQCAFCVQSDNLPFKAASIIPTNAARLTKLKILVKRLNMLIKVLYQDRYNFFLVVIFKYGFLGSLCSVTIDSISSIFRSLATCAIDLFVLIPSISI